jgi:flagellar biosynthesis protein FlhG
METVEDQTTELRQAMASVKKSRVAPPVGGSGPRVIAVASGKGGVGKTNISSNLALALHQSGARTCILDGDLGLSNVNILLGELPKWNLFHVIKGERRLEDVVTRTQWGPDLVAGASGFQELANLDPAARERFITGLSGLQRYDYLVIDTGAGIGANVTGFLLAAHDVLVVTTPEPTAVTDAYGLIKSLVASGRTKNINLIVNRVPSVAEGRKVAERICGIAYQFLRLQVELLGVIHEDPQVIQSVYQRKPFLVIDPKGRASAGIRALGDRLRGRPAPDPSEGHGLTRFFKHLFGGGS